MWGKEGNEAGGYFHNESTTPVVDNKKVYKSQNVVPLTIRQIVQSKDGVIKIGRNTDVHMISVVGRLVQKHVKSTLETYTFEDDTARISAVVFKGNEDDAATGYADHPLGQYYRVHGSLASHGNENRLMMYSMRPISSLNDVTTHLLEVVHAAKKMAKLDADMNMFPGGAANAFGGPSVNGGAGNTSMAVDHNASRGDNKASVMTPAQQTVYKIIQQNSSVTGIEKATLIAALNKRVSNKELDEIIEFLASEGHIYTTLDDTTYQATEL